MAQPTWTADNVGLNKARSGRLKFFVAGGLILVAIALLVVQAIRSEGQFFITIEEYYAQPAKYAGRDFRMKGFVIGDTINFEQIDAQNSALTFTVVDNIENPTVSMQAIAYNQPLPDLLRHEAEAIMEGGVDAQGRMVVSKDGLLLKCPTRYEDGTVVYETNY
jgi:cytochrome c-type biogenesis protein CcmE